MKIAIASTTNDLQGEISAQGGRAPYYLIFAENELLEAIKNPFAVGGGGAGYGVAKMLADKGVQKVVVGDVGGNMQTALAEKGIEHETASGSVQEYLK